MAVEPALDRWEGVKGSRAVDVAVALDAPLVLVVDARERGATAAAAACGARVLAGGVEFAGAIVVGGDDQGAAVGPAAHPRGDRQAARARLAAAAAQRAVRAPVRRRPGRPAPDRPAAGQGGEAALCREAGTFLDREGLEAAAARRGYLPARPRRLLAPLPAAAGLTLAVAWGPPLQPFALDAVDLFKAMGLTLEPLHVGRDAALPGGRGRPASSPACSTRSSCRRSPATTRSRPSSPTAIDGGLPVLALGGGALLLLRRLADSRGRTHELAGVLPAEAELLEWYERPRYVRATAARENPYAEGDATLYELFDLEFLTLQQEAFAWRVGEPGEEGQVEGFVDGRCLATTLVPSLPAMPGLAEAFVAAMRLAAPDA